jgi:hypothetical protein
MTQPEIVVLTKSTGPLTKSIGLGDDGSLHNDSSACVMSIGTAARIAVPGIAELGELIAGLKLNQALALGALRSGLPQKVEVTTKRKIEALNGSVQPSLIARTADYLEFKPEQPGFELIDFDTKGMPPEINDRIDRAGGLWPVLLSVIPELAGVARLERASTSAGLYRKDTGAPVPGSNGLHVYIAVQDASDSERFLKALHDRCWLAGFGWMMVGKAGQMLERSIIDRSVGRPERLVFEAPPVLAEPLAQDAEARRPRVTAGEWLDTKTACPPLTIAEKSQLDELRIKAKHQLAGKSDEAREAFIGVQADALVKRSGVTMREARAIIGRQCEGELLPSIVLPFDDPKLAGKTGADVLADPEAFVRETLADPLEGPDYGPCKAMILRRADGTVFINSFAHGGIRYELKLDAAAIRIALSTADKADVIPRLVELLSRAAIEPADEQALIDYARERSGIAVREFGRQFKRAREVKAAEAAKAAREQRRAERNDPRPQLPVPAPDAEWLPQMDALNDVLGKVGGRNPPARDIEGNLVCVRRIALKGTHDFVSANENGDAAKAAPAPSQFVIHRLSEAEAAEMIERHIEHVDKNDRPVQYPTPFVRHYMKRQDGNLPIIAAVATLPLVSPDGALICADGLDRKRGIFFVVDPGLMKIIPNCEACGDEAVAEAMRLLCDDWLVDVATDHAGKCVLIAKALTMIERSLLDQRPAWFVSAGTRGSGKTTTINMIVEAVTGSPAAASAWSPNEEERRKALLSYLMQGAAYILWDNIARGAQISCQHIEKACTSEIYADRKLGVSELAQASASSIHIFTGNNVGPKGDLASRSLQARLDVDCPDPENREFKHRDPIGWTRDNRSQILRALFVILLGNPALRLPHDASMKTRFKMWQRLVGAAVEHASRCAYPDLAPVDFSRLFLDQEADDEDATSLTDMLRSLSKIMAGKPSFEAADVAGALNGLVEGLSLSEDQRVVRDFLFPNQPSGAQVLAPVVGRKLKDHVGHPVSNGAGTFVLKADKNTLANRLRFRIENVWHPLLTLAIW